MQNMVYNTTQINGIQYIVVQILVINIGICFASSYNVFRADLKLLYRFFESVAREKTLQ